MDAELVFFYCGLQRVELRVYEWNERARKKYQKLRFVSEGRRRGFLWSGVRWWDCIHMRILANEWEVEKKAADS